MQKFSVLLLAISLLFSSATHSAIDLKAVASKLQNNSSLTSLGITNLKLTMLEVAEDSLGGSFSLDFQLPSKLSGKKLSLGGEVHIEDPTSSTPTYKLSTADGKGISWADAFGMKFLDFTDVGIAVEIKGNEVDVALTGRFDGKNIEIDLVEESGKITDFTFKMDDTLKLSELDGVKELPGSDEISVENVVISADAIKGSTSFKGETVNAVVFKGLSGAWNAVIDIEHSISLGKIVGHEKGLLNKIVVPKVHVVISHKGIHANYDELPEAAQGFFSDFEHQELSVAAGFSLHGHFVPSALSSDVKKALGAIGLSKEIPISGTIEGVFGGTKAIEIEAELSEAPNHSIKFLKSVKAKEVFFLRLQADQFAFGFSTHVELPNGKSKQDLIFETDFMIQMQETEVEVAVKGEMAGTWKNAMTIKGFDIIDPSLQVGINETGSFDILIDGTFHLGAEEVEIAADMVLSPEAAFLPTALAFAGKINVLSFSQMTSAAAKMLKGKKKLKGGGLHGINAELRDVHFLIMTPGSQLPPKLQAEYSISGAGFAMGASLWVNKKELGKADGYVSDEGISFDGKIDPFKLGPLQLKEAELLVEAGATKSPKLEMKGEIVLFKGFEDKYEIDVEADKFRFYTDTKFGGLFEVELDAETTHGLSFSKNNDFKFDSKLKANFNKVFHKLTEDAAKAFHNGDKKLGEAQKKVASAQKKVNGLNSKIKDAKKQAERDYDKAAAKINKAKSKVDGIKRTISKNKKKASSLKSSIKHDKKKWRFDRAAKHGIELAAIETAIGTETAALKTAEGVLNAAKKTTKGVVRGINPKVRALQVELGTATAALKVAQGTLKAAKATNDGMAQAVKAISKGLSAFQVKEIRVAGSLDGLISAGKHGTSPVLTVVCKVGKKTHNYTVAVGKGVKNFEKLVGHLAKKAAQDVINVFKKK